MEKKGLTRETPPTSVNVEREARTPSQPRPQVIGCEGALRGRPQGPTDQRTALETGRWRELLGQDLQISAQGLCCPFSLFYSNLNFLFVFKF